MARTRKRDYPGAWWHVTNRGLAKRTVFESDADVARFAEFLSEALAAGLLEVHAFSFLTTHFHLLVRSLEGELSEAMGRILNLFVRWFNRARKRDGSLFRGRFIRKRIDDPAYWETVLRYIDLNPVRAKMCQSPGAYPHGSAAAYCHGEGPAWLVRSEVERVVGTWAGGDFGATEYEEYASLIDPDVVAFLVERRLAGRGTPAQPIALSDLVRGASLRQQNWMEWKTGLADGTRPGAVLLEPHGLLRLIERARPHLRRASALARHRYPVRELAAGLLRAACGLTLSETAEHLGVATSTVHSAVRRDARRLRDDPSYLELRNRIVACALRRAYPPPTSALVIPPFSLASAKPKN